MTDRLDIALTEYLELRAEIRHNLQAKAALFGLALTATATVGSIGLGNGSKREVLLVLPFVLSGLALIYLNYAVLTSTIARFIRFELWPVLGGPPGASVSDEIKLPSWETWVAEERQQRGRLSPTGLLTFLGQGLVFGAPSIAALVLTKPPLADGALEVVWWIGAVFVFASISLIVVVDQQMSQEDRTAQRPPEQ